MKEFLRFSYHFGQLFWLTRGVLLCLTCLITLGGIVLWLFDTLPLGEAIYLAFITALTIGYGDLTPMSVGAQVTAVIIGYVGMIFMGLTVGVATVALKRAI